MSITVQQLTFLTHPVDGLEALCFRVVRPCVRASGRRHYHFDRLAVYFSVVVNYYFCYTVGQAQK